MPVTFIPGQYQEFVAEKDFSLNFDDRNIKSVKIRIGEIVNYDGDTVILRKGLGGESSGPCRSLKAAINSMKWLIPKDTKTEEQEHYNIFKEERSDYNDLTGGNFDTYMKKESGINTVGNNRYKVMQENDFVVKTFDKPEKNTVKDNKNKLEVVGDQVEVRDKLIVNSSTVVPKYSNKKYAITVADEGGSEGTIPLKSNIKTSESQPKKKSYIVDNKTPNTIPEDMTQENVKKFTQVIVSNEPQEAKVLGKVDRSKIKVENVEGIILRKPEPQKKDIEFIKVDAPKEMTIKTTVSAGSTPIGDSSDGVVVGTVSNPTPKKTIKQAKDQKTIIEESLKKAKLVKPVIEESKSEAASDYMTMLPEDWGTMHWVKKEVFIKELTDINFIKFIISVETIKAVENACIERLKELEK